jgi:hypothetical protein
MPHLFTGKVGKLKDFQAKLHIDTSIKPVQQKLRHIPFHIRDAVEAEIKKMLDQDLIEPIKGPTPWVSPIVPIPKPNAPNEIRICTDAREANQAIMRERHNTPTIDDLTVKLNGAAVISKFDLKSGYNQILIDPASRYITAFCTHMGIFQYKRLNFGINTASEIFQKAIEQVISGIEGVLNISDDIIVIGENQKQHDERLQQVFNRLSESGLTVNEKKCELSRTELDFFGLRCSAKGISMQTSKFEALKNAAAPKTSGEVRSLLGLANYCSRFIQNLATITKPLRELTKKLNKNERWNWTSDHDQSLNELKDAIIDKTLAYFNKDWRTEVTVDASPVGLGLVMAQYDPNKPEDKRVIMYASRTLTDVETRYSQVEKEGLAVVWALEKLHLYLYGREFDIITDNKAIELLYGNPKSKPKAKLERWCLRLLPYKFKIKHQPGDGNIADYLSRNPIEDLKIPDHEDIAERYVNFIASSKIPRALNKCELIEATQNDEELTQVKNMITNKHFDDVSTIFKRIKDELSITQDGLVLRGNNIVIPRELQSRIIDIAHAGHQGIVRTKQLVRNHVWFSGIDEAVENAISKCVKCQSNTNSQRLEPLNMSEMPKEPWTNVCIDYYGPIRNGKYLFVLIDEHSRYPIVRQVSSTSFKALKPILDDIFAMFGIPCQVKSDNGPPFNSYNFKSYAADNGFRHKRITPLWPRANGLCERFMKNLGKVMKNAAVDDSKWESELLDFLRSYRGTPHASTRCTPNDLMFKTKRSTTKMPVNVEKPSSNASETAIRNDAIAKARMKRYGDKNLRTRPSELEVGDLVLLKRETKLKNETIYDPDPYRITEMNGTQAIIWRNGKSFRRNVSVLKRFNKKSDRYKQKTSTTVRSEVFLSNPNNERESSRDNQKKSIEKQNSSELNSSTSSNSTSNDDSNTNTLDNDEPIENNEQFLSDLNANNELFSNNLNESELNNDIEYKSPNQTLTRSPIQDEDNSIVDVLNDLNSDNINRTSPFDNRRREGDVEENIQESIIHQSIDQRKSGRSVKAPEFFGSVVSSDQRKQYTYKDPSV